MHQDEVFLPYSALHALTSAVQDEVLDAINQLPLEVGHGSGEEFGLG
jgi:hypothetical protein